MVFAVVLGASHALVYQSHAFEWGGLLRSLVLLGTMVAIVWLGAKGSAARRVRPRGHARSLWLAGAWAMIVVLVAGWFWIVPADGQDAGPAVTTLVALVGVLPLALVGLRLVRLSRGQRS